MSHTIDYSNLPEGTYKQKKAMDDIRNYLGSSFFKMHEAVKAEVRKGMTIDSLRVQCSMFIGIEGYPVQAWFATVQDEIAKESK